VGVRIAVFGATGLVGSRIVTEAVSRGHDVTGISRRGGEVPGAAARAGDLGDAETVREVASTHDVVVLATVPSRTGGDHGEWLDAVRTALANVGSTRVVMVGGAGSLELPDGTRLVDAPGFPEEYRPEGQTMAAALDLARSAPESVDWTFLCPAPVIMPGERTGAYQVGLDAPAGDDISAEDFAVALVDELERPAHRRLRFTVAS
jgi:putative NADH-flavin reductase